MPAGSTYEPIQTTTLGSATASYTFNSIPSTYTDLVIIFSGQQNSTYSGRNLNIRFNGDSGTNYSSVQILATGDGNAYTGADANQTGCYGPLINSTGTTSGPSAVVMNIQNYTNTTTYKTMVNYGGSASVYSSGTNVGVWVGNNVSTWRNTAAITSVTVLSANGDLTSGSTLTLYGIKAA
jgi:hypothetical protein